MNNQIVPQTVVFNNQEILTFEQNGVQYTAMKPICENIGIDWDSQRKRIERDDILSKVACMIKVVAQDNKIREMLSLPIQFLNGWLFGVDSKRVKTDEAKKNLLKYKLECYQVLNDYWHKGEAVNPRFEKISETQAYQLKTAVEKRCKNNKEHYQTVWTALKHRFEVPKYTDILVKDFDNAMNLVWTIALPVLEQSQPDYSQNNALWKTIGLLQYEDVSKTIVLMEALIQQGMVQIKNLKKQRSLIWDALEQQKAPILDPVIRAGLVQQARDFIAQKNALDFV